MNRRINTVLITAAIIFLLILFRLIPDSLYGSTYPALRFCGGAREVGGSCYMLEVDDSTSLLVDCGAMSDAGLDILPPEPEGIDFMILTHAHSDHCGLIPELFQAGFSGRVYCASPTDQLVPVMLGMARSFKKERVPRQIYDIAISSITGVEFNEYIKINNISFRFLRAEHLLGAASVEVLLRGEEDTTRVLFSGDLGAGNSVLLPPPEICPRADYVVMESTYGGRVREEDPREGRERFASSVAAALRRGGDVLIPAFTLGRTQEIISVLEIYRRKGLIPSGTIFYSDSPTARRISDIYRKNISSFDRTASEGGYLETSALREVRSRSSLPVHKRKHSPAVFISSSGNLQHANSPRHLMRIFADSRNLLCLVGWQPPRSLGRRLQNGEDPVLVRYSEKGRYHRKWISPALEIRSFSCFSGHADQNGLLEWLGAVEGVKKVFLIHGEYGQAGKLKNKITGPEVAIPERGERIAL
ncbi:MBL fold metallo-hydrolase [bacterium]|nr:MBL fold metallo-hydrolase [bacterium]